MPRYTERTEMTMPQFTRAARIWFGTNRNAKLALGLHTMSEDTFNRICRVEKEKPEFISAFENAIYAYAKKHQMPQLEELFPSTLIIEGVNNG